MSRAIDRVRLIDSRIAVDRLEPVRGMVGAFRSPEQQEAVRFQGIMECRADLMLEFPIKIDQQVAAGDEVELGEGWVFQHAMVCKKDEIPQLALDALELSLRDKKATQPPLAHLRLDRA